MENRELPFVRGMFDSIAPTYDLLNRLLSLRQDVKWRKTMVESMPLPENGTMLDVATGTADVLIEAARQKDATVRLYGIDFSPGMLAIGKKKIDGCPESHRIELLAGDAFFLPFRNESFDAVTIAFGIRNITDRETVLKEFHRCLKPGGVVLILEPGTPKSRVFQAVYSFYFKKLLPFFGGLISRNKDAYKYLPASVTRFPAPEVFSKTLHTAGFRRIRWKPLTFGTAILFLGEKQ